MLAGGATDEVELGAWELGALETGVLGLGALETGVLGLGALLLGIDDEAGALAVGDGVSDVAAAELGAAGRASRVCVTTPW